MMHTLRYTLIADGSSDSTLLSIIRWSLNSLYPKLATEACFADFRLLPHPPKTLEEKARRAASLFPYDILFVHRDAEFTDNNMIEIRMQEIKEAIGAHVFEHTVCIVPVKMMETWLLISEEAIKQAAGNRNYKQAIALPSPKNLEREANPKQTLHTILKTASGLTGRRLSAFNVHQAVHLVAEYTQDYSPLRQLQAYRAFEEDLQNKVEHFLHNI